MVSDLKKKLLSITTPVVGEVYFHYRDTQREKPYIIRAIALREDSLEPAVIYEALYGDHLTWDRALKDWNSSVLYQNEIVPRFTLKPSEDD